MKILIYRVFLKNWTYQTKKKKKKVLKMIPYFVSALCNITIGV